MTPAELAWRVAAAGKTWLQSKGVGLAPRAIPTPRASGRAWVGMLPSSVGPAPYLAQADQLLAGTWNIFALRDVQLGFPPDWKRHPKTGAVAPMGFGKTLNYRDETVVVGAIKYYWELNRHLELPRLAQAYRLSGETRYLAACQTLLDSWFEACPYPFGLNWTSSLEHAIRLANWSVAWHLLGGDASPLFEGAAGEAFRQRWMTSVYQHCHFVAGHFSLHSSANNHLLGEYLGLYLGSVTWPAWPESAAWRILSKTRFEEEALKQNARDGVNREQATWYQHEVIDMMLLCGLFGRANDDDFSSAYWRRIEALLEFFAATMDGGGHQPLFGDADDAVIVRFSAEPAFDAFRSQLATGAVLFERADFAAKIDGCDDKTRWLLGDRAETILGELRGAAAARAEPKRAFPEGGYYVLGDRFGEPDEIRLVADAGPLGYLSIAAHGHADALSFTLSAAGQPLLIDPGTYAYHTQKQWRDYFRGTSAHNTLRVDGVDQSVIGGSFLWLRAAQAQCQQFESDAGADVFVGEHDGYSRLDDPVVHRREIRLNKAQRRIQVRDTLRCKDHHQVELHWHCAAECAVVIEDAHVVVRRGAVRLEIAMPGCDWVPGLVRGRDDPPLGWVSPGFDQKRPSTTIVWRGEIGGPITFETELRLAFAP